MSAQACNRVRVLLVEDDQDDYELTRALLDELGDRHQYDLDWRMTYDSALSALSQTRHDVCLLDYLLGARDGLELMNEAVALGVGVPIIFLTGSGSDRGLERRALAAGAADYLSKSEIDARMLERAIRHSLERARSVRALRERERQFRSIFEGSMDAILLADDEGRFVDGNEAAVSLLGVARHQLVQMRVWELTAPELQNKTRSAWQGFLTDRRLDGELCLIRADGQQRFVEFRATAAITPGRHLIVLHDMTARRAAEHQRLRLAAMVESAAEAIQGVTLDGVIDYWSPAAARMYGYTAAEAVGQSTSLLLPVDKTHELPELMDQVRRGVAFVDHETLRRRKDGKLFEASVTVSPVVEGGEIVAASLITRDISEKKKLEAHLAVSDRMASVGTVAAGVAHEINNPLAALSANLDYMAQCLLEREAAPCAGAHGPGPCAAAHCQSAWVHLLEESLSDARASAGRIRHVVQDLKLFSKPDERSLGPVNLQYVIESSLRVAWNEVRHRARVIRNFCEVPPVEGNEGALGQVFLNLIINAAQAIREGDVGGNEIRLTTRTDERGRVVIDVADTGVGIPATELRRVFEPFFTTKPLDIGTGLGLSICRRIVHQHGGTISVHSTSAEGTTIRVELPPCDSKRAAKSVTQPSSASIQRRGRVLVIDDEPLVLSALQRVLGPQHDVTGTTSAAQALELLRSGAHFDLILCDMMMPQMTGMDFYDALSEAMPEKTGRVVFLTGGAFTAAARAFLERVPNLCMDKPFDARQLNGLIHERIHALDGE